MKKLLILLILSLMMTSFIFGQSIIKKDSLYCRTIEQEKEVIKDELRLDMCDSILSDCQRENKALQGTISSQKTVIDATIQSINLSNGIIAQKDLQITSKVSEVEVLKGDLRRSKVKTVGIGLGTGASLILNLVLGVSLLRR